MISNKINTRQNGEKKKGKYFFFSNKHPSQSASNIFGISYSWLICWFRADFYFLIFSVCIFRSLCVARSLFQSWHQCPHPTALFIIYLNKFLKNSLVFYVQSTQPQPQEEVKSNAEINTLSK